MRVRSKNRLASRIVPFFTAHSFLFFLPKQTEKSQNHKQLSKLGKRIRNLCLDSTLIKMHSFVSSIIWFWIKLTFNDQICSQIPLAKGRKVLKQVHVAGNPHQNQITKRWKYRTSPALLFDTLLGKIIAFTQSSELEQQLVDHRASHIIIQHSTDERSLLLCYRKMDFILSLFHLL